MLREGLKKARAGSVELSESGLTSLTVLAEGAFSSHGFFHSQEVRWGRCCLSAPESADAT